jgi:hypothetical protein
MELVRKRIYFEKKMPDTKNGKDPKAAERKVIDFMIN